MKNPFLILVIFFCVFVACKDEVPMTVTCLNSGLQNGLIAFYTFSNGGLADASGGQHDLTNTTGALPASDRHNNPSCAYQFDNLSGPNQFLTQINPTFLNNLNEFSISIWYIHTNSNTTGYQILVSRGDAARCPDRRGEWSAGLYDCSRAVFGHDNSVWADRLSDPDFSCDAEIHATANNWHHVVAVLNKNFNTYSLYFDGVLNDTVTGIGDCGSSNYIAQDIGDMLLGKYFNGKLDDVLIYDRALSAQEVGELYELEGCCDE